MEIPVPALFMAHLFVFGLTMTMYVAAVFVFSPDPRKPILIGLALAWPLVSLLGTILAAVGLGALSWLLWFVVAIGGIVVLARAAVVGRAVRRGRRAAQLPTDGPLMW
jgi:hypothetical protein